MLDKLDVLFRNSPSAACAAGRCGARTPTAPTTKSRSSYFSLDSKESLAVLQKERKGTLLVDVQRRINMYLRALWARDFFMRPTAGDFETREGYRPYIEDYLLHLPDAFDDFAPEATSRSPAWSSTAPPPRTAPRHLVETRQPISAEALNPLQMAVIGGDRGRPRRSAGDPPLPWPEATLEHSCTPPRRR